jgi:DNA polymerase I-like protein with 3'-5' exonuclease and polymerase domains
MDAIALFKSIAAPYIVSPPKADKCGDLRLAFDCEADALLNSATKVHCICICDLDREETYQYGPEEIGAGLAHLQRAGYLTGHAISSYDLPLFQRLFGWTPKQNCKICDALIIGRLLFPHISELDDRVAAITKRTLGKLRGRFSLEAWGARLGIAKIGTDIENWTHWTPEIQERCVGDATISKALWQFLQPEGYSQRAIELEHRAAVVCERITADGVPFAATAAGQLERQWTARRAVLETKLAQQFPGVKLTSRRQIAAVLEARGWVPEKRTEKTKQPKIDDELLETLPAVYPEFAGLAEYLLLGRRLAALSTGKEAWLKHVRADGRIHGGIISIGTPHSRAKHSKPNLAQVPNPKKGKPFSAECRALFRSNNDWVFVAADQAGLQDRGFAHYLHPHDGGTYAKTFNDNTDTHWKTTIALELVAEGTERAKDNKLHTAIREGAKTFRYAFIFGAQAARAGQIIYNIVRSVMALDPASNLHRQFFGDTARPSESKLKQIGQKARKRFIDTTPGLAQLKQKLEKHANKHGWLPGLDGRRVPVRALYTALNYIITSSEAIICKRWLVEVYDELRGRFHYGWDGDVVLALWVHDELIACCRPEIADAVGEIMTRRAREAGEFYGFRVPLQADYKIGHGWAEPPEAIEPTTGPAAVQINGTRVEAAQSAIALPENETAPPWELPPAHICADALDKQPPEERLSMAKGTPEHVDARFSEPAIGNGQHNSDGPVHGDDGPRQGKVLDHFVYEHPDRRPMNYLRVGKHLLSGGDRRFYQEHWNGAAWAHGVKGTYAEQKIPYLLPQLREALRKDPNTEVHLGEGEKDANTLARLGYVATTNPGGAVSWTDELTAWLRILGVRRAVLHEDNDEKGRLRTTKLTAALSGFINLRVVRYPDVPPGEDVTWWLTEGGHTLEELRARIETAPFCTAALESICAGDLEMENYEWLWPGRFALGEIGLLVGMPDVGKGQVLAHIAGRVTRALAWPNGEGQAPLGNVVLLTSEDNLRKTVYPRLEAAGADCKRVHILKMVGDIDPKTGKSAKRMLSLATDLERLREKIVTIGNVNTVQIDPITAYLGIGKVDSYRTSDVRAILGPLKDLAEELSVAVIGIMHFNKKIDVTNVLLRVSDSLAFVAAPRHVFGVIHDPENSRTLVVSAKNNLADAEQKRRSLAYHFEVKQVGIDRKGAPIEAPFIVWEPGYVDVSASEALSAAAENKAPAAVNDAKDFLRGLMTAGGKKVPRAEIEEAADAEGISERTLWRAKKALGIKAEKDKTVNGQWTWIMPDDEGGQF